MTPAAIRQLQQNLGIPATGIFDAATNSAMTMAISNAVAGNKDIAKYAKAASADDILGAYMTGNWSGVTDLTGKPFTDKQQQAAVTEASKVLAPAYEAQQAYDQAGVQDTLQRDAQGFQDFQNDEKKNFIADKGSLDKSAADSGILFSGARAQKLRDLRTTYADREAIQRRQTAGNIASAARANQYSYGNDAAGSLKSLYALPGSTTFNPNVAGGGVTRSGGLSSAYNPSQFNFQGTAPVAQKAAVQVRAASQLANKANKLSLAGYGTKL